MANKIFFYGTGATSMVFIFILCLYFALWAVMFNLWFYGHEYDKYNIYSNMGMEKEELLNVTQSMIDYVADDSQSLEVVVTINGQKQDFFNQKEKEHMSDVKAMFTDGKKVVNLGAFMLVITLAMPIVIFKDYRNKKKYLYWFTKNACIFLSLITAIIICLGVWVGVDFNRSFLTFHILFFDNELWKLDPRTSLVINAFPAQFFKDAAMVVAVIFFAIVGVIITASLLYLKAAKKGS